MWLLFNCPILNALSAGASAAADPASPTQSASAPQAGAGGGSTAAVRAGLIIALLVVVAKARCCQLFAHGLHTDGTRRKQDCRLHSSFTHISDECICFIALNLCLLSRVPCAHARTHTSMCARWARQSHRHRATIGQIKIKFFNVYIAIQVFSKRQAPF